MSTFNVIGLNKMARRKTKRQADDNYSSLNNNGYNNIVDHEKSICNDNKVKKNSFYYQYPLKAFLINRSN